MRRHIQRTALASSAHPSVAPAARQARISSTSSARSPASMRRPRIAAPRWSTTATPRSRAVPSGSSAPAAVRAEGPGELALRVGKREVRDHRPQRVAITAAERDRRVDHLRRTEDRVDARGLANVEARVHERGVPAPADHEAVIARRRRLAHRRRGGAETAFAGEQLRRPHRPTAGAHRVRARRRVGKPVQQAGDDQPIDLARRGAAAQQLRRRRGRRRSRSGSHERRLPPAGASAALDRRRCPEVVTRGRGRCRRDRIGWHRRGPATAIGW